MTIALLILHGLLAVSLLGAITHQLVSLLRGRHAPAADRHHPKSSFMGRYLSVGQSGFTMAIVVLYFLTFVLGGIIYPAYRIDVRIPFEEMRLAWAVGLFEVKEHWGGIGVGVLPLYAYVWRAQNSTSHGRNRMMITVLLALIVWADFIIGHVLNNIRGL